LGVATLWLTILLATVASRSTALFELVRQSGPTLCRTILLLAVAKLVWDAMIFRHLLTRRVTPMRRSALLMTRELSNTALARFAAGLLGGVIMPAMLASQLTTSSNETPLVQFVVMTGLMFVACLTGELLERYLFFAACAAPRMPGAIR
jgi:hypothetical protein